MARPTARAIFLALAIVLLAYVPYSKRLQIAATVWHWRNGDFAHVDNYEVPVPKNWLVKDDRSGLLLIDTRRHGNEPVLSGINIITVGSFRTPTPDLEFWKSYKRKWLKDHGISIIEERSLRFEDETVACSGGHEMQEMMHIPNASDVVSLECRSSGKLYFIFVGQPPDLQVFYSIIPKIRKRK